MTINYKSVCRGGRGVEVRKSGWLEGGGGLVGLY